MSEFVADQEVLRLAALCKAYNPGTPLEQEVLHGIDLRLTRG
ncbi:MAG TPA: ABC transporter ATP-binding protein, partial [Pseudomonas sp.]|nr:ABC transporter ATP-binding protein [Pseudomonas sp.]